MRKCIALLTSFWKSTIAHTVRSKLKNNKNKFVINVLHTITYMRMNTLIFITMQI